MPGFGTTSTRHRAQRRSAPNGSPNVRTVSHLVGSRPSTKPPSAYWARLRHSPQPITGGLGQTCPGHRGDLPPPTSMTRPFCTGERPSSVHWSLWNWRQLTHHPWNSRLSGTRSDSDSVGVLLGLLGGTTAIAPNESLAIRVGRQHALRGRLDSRSSVSRQAIETSGGLRSRRQGRWMLLVHSGPNPGTRLMGRLDSDSGRQHRSRVGN
jgi:hypothetical protein